ncbi:MAG: histidine kinase [Anaerolineae bacterium]|nr:histidine kinase [Anaerolineae bacterium]
MTPRIARMIAWSLVGIYIILSATGLYLQVLTPTAIGNTTLPLILFIIAVIVVGIWPIIGAQILSHHPRHPVGWLLFITFPLIAIPMFAIGYASYALSHTPDLLPLPRAIHFWLSDTALPIAIVTNTLMNLLFPTGKFLSSRWRLVAWTGIAVLPIFLAFQTVRPGPLALFPSLNNPYAVSESVWAALAPFYFALIALLTLCSLASVVSLFLRMRWTRGDEPQQVKWLVLPAVVYWIGIPVSYLAEFDPSGMILNVGVGLHLISVPAIVIAVAFAIFKYRLYDIDLIISRTLVYGALTAIVVAVYVLIVGFLGSFIQVQGNLLITLLATGLIAVLFQPLRERLQRAVNRLIFGERDDPIEALSRLGKQMEVALPSDQVLPALVKTIAQTLKLPFVGITLKGQRDISFGQETENLAAFPFTFQGETSGVLLASPRNPGDKFTPGEMRLLQNLARQAGAAVRNAQLTADLQRSRQTLVTAREEERHCLRRDLHDGIGPAMAGLTLKLDAAKDLVSSGLETGEKQDLEEAVQLLGELKTQTQETVRNIRDIVHTLRPPSLDVLGLIPALQAHVGQVAIPNRLKIHMRTSPQPQDFPRLSAAVEVATYRIVLEAVTNVINHADASECEVSLTLENGNLKIEIKDDGIGLTKARSHGIGLDSMRERAEELSGRFELSSSPRGTQVRAEIPIDPTRNRS